jgi:hypothetical protein
MVPLAPRGPAPDGGLGRLRAAGAPAGHRALCAARHDRHLACRPARLLRRREGADAARRRLGARRRALRGRLHAGAPDPARPRHDHDGPAAPRARRARQWRLRAGPRAKQPYTHQANFGFAKTLGNGFAVEVDGVYARGRDLGLRPRLNTRTAGGTSPRRLVGILSRTGAADFRIDISEGRSDYKGVSLTLKKQWDGKLQFLGSYTLSESRADGSLRATDEFGEYDVLDPLNPFADNQVNPTRTDNRHRVTIVASGRPATGSRWPRSSVTSRPSRSTSSRASTRTGTAATTTCRRASRHSTAVAARASCSSTCACPRVPAQRPHRSGADRRGLQPHQRHEPGQLRGQHDDGDVRSADAVRGRLPARRAAAVPAGAEVRVLVTHGLRPPAQHETRYVARVAAASRSAWQWCFEPVF